MSKWVMIAGLGGWCLFIGCLEHKYQIVVHSDGTANLLWRLSGDFYDLWDGMTLMPDSNQWTISQSIEEKEDQTIHHLQATLTQVPIDEVSKMWDWRRIYSDTLFLQPYLQVKRYDNPIFTIYIFNGLFPSRMYDELYGDIWDYVPPECRALEDVERLRSLPSNEVDLLEKKFALGIIQWNKARYEKAFYRVWEISRQRTIPLKDTTDDEFSISYSGWIDDLHRFLNQLDVPRPEIVNLDWWKELRPQFLGRFADLLPEHRVSEVANIADALEREYYITRDIQDDQFVVEVVLPGIIYNHNGTLITTDSLYSLITNPAEKSSFKQSSSTLNNFPKPYPITQTHFATLTSLKESPNALFHLTESKPKEEQFLTNIKLSTLYHSRIVQWSFSGRDLHNQAFIMSARSIRFKPVPLVAMSGFLVGIFLGLLYRKNLKRKQLEK